MSEKENIKEVILMDLMDMIDDVVKPDIIGKADEDTSVSDRKFCKQVFVACFLSAGYAKVYPLIPGCLENVVKDVPSDEEILKLLKKSSLVEEYKKAVETISLYKAMSILS